MTLFGDDGRWHILLDLAVGVLKAVCLPMKWARCHQNCVITLGYYTTRNIDKLNWVLIMMSPLKDWMLKVTIVQNHDWLICCQNIVMCILRVTLDWGYAFKWVHLSWWDGKEKPSEQSSCLWDVFRVFSLTQVKCSSCIGLTHKENSEFSFLRAHAKWNTIGYHWRAWGKKVLQCKWLLV